MPAASTERHVDKHFADHHGVISRREALGLGMTTRMIEGRLASGRWTRVHPAVYRLSAAGRTWHADLRAAVVWAGAEALASHRAAGCLWRLEGLDRSPLEIVTRSGHRRPGIIVHRLRSDDRPPSRMLDGIPVTGIERTLFDLAALLSPRGTGVALDDALRRGLTTLPRLQGLLDLEGGPGRRGTASLRRLVAARDQNDTRTESELEGRLLRLLRRSRLPLPSLQHEVWAGGRLVARLDFAYPDARLGVEVHGFRFHGGREHWQRDIRRENLLKRVGWLVLVFTWDDVVGDGRRVVAEIASTLAERLRDARTSMEGMGVGWTDGAAGRDTA